MACRDFLYTKDIEMKDDLLKMTESCFQPAPMNYDMWTSDVANDVLESIFSLHPDILKEDESRVFDSLDDLSEHIRREAEQYECLTDRLSPFDNFIEKSNLNTLSTPIFQSVSSSISSNCSDSGLSSDNLDIELSPEYEPLSPSSFPDSINSSRKNVDHSESSATSSSPTPTVISAEKIPTVANNTKPKVIVQKVQQEFNAFAGENKIIKSQPRPLNTISSIKELKIVKLSQPIISSVSNNKILGQVKSPQKPTKFHTVTTTVFPNKTINGHPTKYIRIKNQSNPRSILLPVSIQDVKDLGICKIINATALKKPTISGNGNVPVKFSQQPILNISKSNYCLPKYEVIDDSLFNHTSDSESYAFEEIHSDSGDFIENSTYDSEQTIETDHPFPKLNLNPEEHRLLAKEGISLPSHYPLTKQEERELKRIRRKIRNKISAQDSRKRKKEYVDGLEERVKQCTQENQTLLKRIKLLQNQNQTLVTQMKKLQSLLIKCTSKTTQPGTCFMVLLLSLALIAAPNLKLTRNSKEVELAEVVKDTILQNRRSLLFDAKEQSNNFLDDDITLDDVLLMNDVLSEDQLLKKIDGGKYSELSDDEAEAPVCKKAKTIADIDVDDQNWYHRKEVEDMHKTSKDSLEATVTEPHSMNKQAEQTSGFNIDKKLLLEHLMIHMKDKIDVNMLDLISEKPNGVFELNLDNIIGLANKPDLLTINNNKSLFDDKINNNNIKLNVSDLDNAKKY